MDETGSAIAELQAGIERVPAEAKDRLTEGGVDSLPVPSRLAGEFSVAFTVDDRLDADAVIVAPLTPTEPNEQPRDALVLALPGAQAMLQQGMYLAALRSEGGTIGSEVTFAVVDRDQVIPLRGDDLLDVSLVITDGATEIALGGALCTATRDLPPGLESTQDTHEATSGADGYVLLERLPAGTWRLEVAAEDYATHVQTADWRRSLASEQDRSRRLNAGGVALAPVTEVAFQLVGGGDRSDLSDFRIAHTFTGRRVPFDGLGRAVLSLGWFDTPLYVALWYPSGESAIHYLDGGLPKDGSAHSIDVGGKRSLDLAVTASAAALQQIDAAEAYVRAAFRSKEGDAVVVSQPWAGEAVYRFDSTQSGQVMVSVATTHETVPTEWAALRVSTEEQGRTSAQLHVASPPLELRFIDRAGDPIPQLNWEVLLVPDDTTWLAGGTTGGDGIGHVCRIPNSECRLSTYFDPLRLLALDVPIDLGTRSQAIEVALNASMASYVEVRCGETPVEGAVVSFFGGASGVEYFDVRTGDDGRSFEFHLPDRHQGACRVAKKNYWSRNASTALQPGRNLVLLEAIGVLRLDLDVSLADVTWRTTGATLQDWVDAGRVTSVGTSGLQWAVPVGTYEWQRGDGTLAVRQVSVGQ